MSFHIVENHHFLNIAGTVRRGSGYDDAGREMDIVKPHAVRAPAFRLILCIAEFKSMETGRNRTLELAPVDIARQRVAQFAVEPEEEASTSLGREDFAVVGEGARIRQVHSKLQHGLGVQRVVVAAACTVTAAVSPLAGDLPTVLCTWTLPCQPREIATLPILCQRRVYLRRQRKHPCGNH